MTRITKDSEMRPFSEKGGVLRLGCENNILSLEHSCVKSLAVSSLQKLTDAGWYQICGSVTGVYQMTKTKGTDAHMMRVITCSVLQLWHKQLKQRSLLSVESRPSKTKYRKSWKHGFLSSSGEEVDQFVHATNKFYWPHTQITQEDERVWKDTKVATKKCQVKKLDRKTAWHFHA